MLPLRTPATLLDAGCGLGDLSAYLKLKGYTNLDYTGIDIVPEMIAAAQKKYPDRKFSVQDLATVNQKYDYIIASGALNIVYQSQETQFDYICRYVTQLFEHSTVACGFNCLSIHSIEDFDQDSRFYYTDPHALLAYCKLLTKNAKLITGYLPYDFTIILKK
jgi:cyclopropane fatty-acyl-phospholipid synthase-like methyltransferase